MDFIRTFPFSLTKPIEMIFREFDKDSMLIIDRCFQIDETFAVDLLKEPLQTFDRLDPLELAEKANCRSFLASKTVQKSLDQKWFSIVEFSTRKPSQSFSFLFFFHLGLVRSIINVEQLNFE